MSAEFTLGLDVYNRELVECLTADGESINNRLVEQGFAEWYRRTE